MDFFFNFSKDVLLNFELYFSEKFQPRASHSKLPKNV